MRAEQREALRVRFQFRCGYCGVSERINRPLLVAYRLSNRRETELIRVLHESLREQEQLGERVAALEKAVAEVLRRLRSLE